MLQDFALSEKRQQRRGFLKAHPSEFTVLVIQPDLLIRFDISNENRNKADKLPVSRIELFADVPGVEAIRHKIGLFLYLS